MGLGHMALPAIQGTIVFRINEITHIKLHINSINRVQNLAKYFSHSLFMVVFEAVSLLCQTQAFFALFTSHSGFSPK